MIGKHALEHGITSAKRKFSAKLGMKLCPSTIHGMKAAYKNELTRKRNRNEEDLTIKALPQMKRGRPVLLGENMDAMVQKYVLKVREKGGVVNTAIVIASAKGNLKQMDRTLLAEYGGHVTVAVSWAKSLQKRMNLTKRRGTTKSGMSLKAF